MRRLNIADNRGGKIPGPLGKHNVEGIREGTTKRTNKKAYRMEPRRWHNVFGHREDTL
jgi:hypothetical protein